MSAVSKVEVKVEIAKEKDPPPSPEAKAQDVKVGTVMRKLSLGKVSFAEPASTNIRSVPQHVRNPTPHVPCEMSEEVEGEKK